MDSITTNVGTDWVSVIATITSGVLAAIATIVAVIYTNSQTKKQLRHQEEKYAEERQEQFRQSKYVVIRPSLLLTTFSNLMDRLIVSNDYNRMMVLSGDDGFDFFDDSTKQANQRCRILQIENFSSNDIVDVAIETITTLQNKDSNRKFVYSTSNSVALMRARESIVIRLANQEQNEAIIDMNKKNIPSELTFDCRILYSTLAKQRITYHYETVIINDRRIEIKADGIIKTADCDNASTVTPTTFRNMQDYISSIDRSSYIWEKMAAAQIRGMQDAMSRNNTNLTQQNNSTASNSNPA